MSQTPAAMQISAESNINALNVANAALIASSAASSVKVDKINVMTDLKKKLIEQIEIEEDYLKVLRIGASPEVLQALLEMSDNEIKLFDLLVLSLGVELANHNQIKKLLHLIFLKLETWPLKRIEFREYNFTENEMIVLAKSLNQNPYLEGLFLCDSNVAATKIHLIIEAYHNNKSLTELFLQGVSICPTDKVFSEIKYADFSIYVDKEYDWLNAAIWLKLLNEKKTYLSKLSLWGMNLNKEAAEELALLMVDSNLNDLWLSDIPIEHSNLKIIFTGFKKSKFLQKFRITCNINNLLNIDISTEEKEFANLIMEGLKTNSKLEELELCIKNGFMSSLAPPIIHTLQNLQTIKSLSLAFTNLQNSDLLKLNLTPSLSELNLNGNQFDFKEMIAFFNRSEHHQNLRTIRFACFDSQVTARSIQECVPIKSFFSLIKIELVGAKLGKLGAALMGGALSNVQHLTHLDLSNNELGNEGFKMICSSLINNLYLNKKVNLWAHKNDIDDKGIMELQNIFLKNSLLSELYLYENKIGEEGVNILKEIIKKYNNSLTTIRVNYTRVEPTLGIDELNSIGMRKKEYLEQQEKNWAMISNVIAFYRSVSTLKNSIRALQKTLQDLVGYDKSTTTIDIDAFTKTLFFQNRVHASNRALPIKSKDVALTNVITTGSGSAATEITIPNHVKYKRKSIEKC